MTRLEVPSSPPGADTFEERWEAWQEKGRVSDAKTRVRSRAVFAVLVFTLGVVSLWMVTGG